MMEPEVQGALEIGSDDLWFSENFDVYNSNEQTVVGMHELTNTKLKLIGVE